MANKLKEKMKKFTQMHTSDGSFGDPYEDDTSIAVSLPKNLEKEKKPKNIDSSFEAKMLGKTDKIEKFLADTKSTDFDSTFDTYFDDDDEDAELKSSLVSYGRKYARDHAMDENDSEINKAFAPQEKKLADIIDELGVDKKIVHDEIIRIKSSGYGANRKMLADLLTAKNSLYSSQLSAIKELNNTKKNKIDLASKHAKEDTGTHEGSFQNGRSIQEILGMGHRSIMDAVGGRDAVSGSLEDGVDYIDTFEESDEMIEKKYFNHDTNPYVEDDGDKFLKYEGKEVSYVLLIDHDTNNRQIIAEDEEGNILTDYPTPSNPNDIDFKMDTNTKTAIDHLNRSYILRDL